MPVRALPLPGEPGQYRITGTWLDTVNAAALGDDPYTEENMRILGVLVLGHVNPGAVVAGGRLHLTLNKDGDLLLNFEYAIPKESEPADGPTYRLHVPLAKLCECREHNEVTRRASIRVPRSVFGVPDALVNDLTN